MLTLRAAFRGLSSLRFDFVPKLLRARDASKVCDFHESFFEAGDEAFFVHEHGLAQALAHAGAEFLEPICLSSKRDGFFDVGLARISDEFLQADGIQQAHADAGDMGFARAREPAECRGPAGIHH